MTVTATGYLVSGSTSASTATVAKPYPTAVSGTAKGVTRTRLFSRGGGDPPLRLARRPRLPVAVLVAMAWRAPRLSVDADVKGGWS
ncbi:hypothetical protein GCM10009555_071790 [Acrocarpospora macrocephala]|uniref:Uncharacterized protein n=1 Tax=Acrocarpospora macrocephala TaxID=150177 RepID=A0A5M3WHR9_9ACTN|nr:hypothetical protein Amac_022710 [Acrocarpospora macrocephala]